MLTSFIYAIINGSKSFLYIDSLISLEYYFGWVLEIFHVHPSHHRL